MLYPFELRAPWLNNSNFVNNLRVCGSASDRQLGQGLASVLDTRRTVGVGQAPLL
jgi:hypothetical protein